MPLIKIADMDGSRIENLSDSEINKMKIPESYKEYLGKVIAATNKYLPETHKHASGKNRGRWNFEITVTKKEDIYALGKTLEYIKIKKENSILNNEYFTDLINRMLDENAGERPTIEDIYNDPEIINLCNDVKREFGMKGELGVFMDNLKIEKEVNKLIDTEYISSNINKKYDGFTALHLACNGGLENIVDSLLKKNADVNSRDKFGYLPQHWAAQKGYVNIVISLIANNADINETTSNGLTMLHLACKNDREPLVEYLLSKKANKGKEDLYFRLKAIDMTSDEKIREVFNK